MDKVLFWLRAATDRRPLSVLLNDKPWELTDFGEIPEGAVYPVQGIHVEGVMMGQRDLSSPVFVLNEIIRMLTTTTAMMAQAKDKAIAHVELVTDVGTKTLLTETGNGQVKASMPTEQVQAQGEPVGVKASDGVRLMDLVMMGAIIVLGVIALWGVVGGR